MPPAIPVRQATLADCPDIAALALIAGEGIPAWFWAESARREGLSIEDAGARNAASETENFSYRNAYVALSDDRVAGMLLAYRLPGSEAAGEPEEYPAFLRPLIELEQCVPDSFYINMVATYPEYRNRGIGSRLMGIVDALATAAGCRESSLQVFGQNTGAVRLYQRLGYTIVERRPAVPHPCHPYTGDILLLTRPVA